jgi:hypothetical protein
LAQAVLWVEQREDRPARGCEWLAFVACGAWAAAAPAPATNAQRPLTCARSRWGLRGWSFCSAAALGAA